MNEENKVNNESTSEQPTAPVVNPLGVAQKQKNIESNPLGLEPMSKNLKFDIKDRKTQIGLGVVVVIIAAIVLYNIFGTNTLTCTESDDSLSLLGFDTSITYKFGFKNDKVSSAKITYAISAGDSGTDLTTYGEKMKSLYESDTEDYKDVSIQTTSDKIIISAKATDKSLEDYEGLTKESLKKELEESGMTCK